MARPPEFIRRIRQRAREVEVGATRIQQQVALAVDQAVVLATPVLSGHARANWQVGIGSPITDEIDDEDKAGGETIARNAADIGRHRGRKDIIISNNVPYINGLNDGTSAQAPAGFVQLAAAEGVKAVSRQRIFKR